MRWLDGITDSMNMSLSKALGDDEREGNLVCSQSDTTEQLNSNNTFFMESQGHMVK